MADSVTLFNFFITVFCYYYRRLLYKTLFKCMDHVTMDFARRHGWVFNLYASPFWFYVINCAALIVLTRFFGFAWKLLKINYHYYFFVNSLNEINLCSHCLLSLWYDLLFLSVCLKPGWGNMWPSICSWDTLLPPLVVDHSSVYENWNPNNIGGKVTGPPSLV